MLRAAGKDRQSLCDFAAHVKPYIIFNPTAGSVTDEQRARTELIRLRPIDLVATRKPGQAAKLARNALRRGCDYLICAGGDGTLNEIVNGVAEAGKKVRIGIVPLGTGNDFARTLGLPISVEENIDILRAAKTRPVDIVRVRGRRARYFVNVAAGGFSGLVRRKITPEIKKSWGPLAYIRAAAAALPKLHAYKATLALDQDEEVSAALYNVIIANGRYAAAGLPIAPDADPADGLLDIVLIPKRSTPEMLVLAAEIILGKHLADDAIICRRARKVSVRSKPGMWFNVDGELVGSVPATFQIVPRALKFVVKR